MCVREWVCICVCVCICMWRAEFDVRCLNHFWSICLSVSVCLPACLPVCLPICLAFCLSLSLPHFPNLVSFSWIWISRSWGHWGYPRANKLELVSSLWRKTRRDTAITAGHLRSRMVREQRAGLSGLLLLYLHAVIHLSLYSFNDLILSQHFLGIMRELFIDGL